MSANEVVCFAKLQSNRIESGPWAETNRMRHETTDSSAETNKTLGGVIFRPSRYHHLIAVCCFLPFERFAYKSERHSSITKVRCRTPLRGASICAKVVDSIGTVTIFVTCFYLFVMNDHDSNVMRCAHQKEEHKNRSSNHGCYPSGHLKRTSIPHASFT